MEVKRLVFIMYATEIKRLCMLQRLKGIVLYTRAGIKTHAKKQIYILYSLQAKTA